MQIIPDNMNAGMHVFETPNDIIINSQIYDKITMELKSCDFLNINAYNNTNILKKEITIINSDRNVFPKEPEYNYYLQDNTNPNIFYTLVLSDKDINTTYFYKIKKDTNKNVYYVSNIIPLANFFQDNYAAFRDTCFKILWQNSDYIIIAENLRQGEDWWNSWGWIDKWGAGSYCSLIRIKKNDLSLSVYNILGTPNTHQNHWLPNSFQDFCIYTLDKYSNENYLYFYFKANTGSFIMKYTISANTLEYTQLDSYNLNSTIGYSNIVYFRDAYYYFNNENNILYLNKLQIINNIPKLIKQYSIANLPYVTGTCAELSNGSYLMTSLNNIDDIYISITRHNNVNEGIFYTADSTVSKTYFSDLKYHRHYLIKYSEKTDSFTLIHTITPDSETQHIYGVLYYNQYTPIFFLNDKILIYKLNLNTEQYEKCFEKAGIFYTIGLDELNNFYIFDDNNNCSIYNECTSNELFAEFEKESYDYEDIDIDTYVTIYSKNFLGDYINTKVKITIEGDCYFKENNLQEIITNTDTELVQIPVTITNSGIMYCHIEEV